MQTLPPVPLVLYDTHTRTMRPIHASDGRTVRIYACGPTIYGRAHIGNFRTFLFSDLLRRTLKLLGYRIQHVMNLTDVDDKTIKGALAAHESLQTYTERYERSFFEDMETLRIDPVEEYPRATAYLPQMIEMIATLVDKGYAYRAADGSIYYRVSAYREYGALSHLDLSTLQQGASGRMSSDEYEKQEAVDFVLWKAHEPTRDGDVFWDSPWGKGRPGWHIECSVMAKALLGETIDLHLGGVDLIFPHHENEIAQSEAANGCPFCHHWAHAEHLLVDGKKMSKSAGNFYTVGDLLKKGVSPSAIRFFLMGTQYRTQLNCTMEALYAAEASVRRIQDCFFRLQAYVPDETRDQSDSLPAAIDEERRAFIEALSKDLHINEALSHLFDTIRILNGAIDAKNMSKEACAQAVQFFQTVDSILDVLSSSKETIPQEIAELAALRDRARSQKNWGESDRIRSLLTERGYRIEDTPSGQKISKLP